MNCLIKHYQKTETQLQYYHESNIFYSYDIQPSRLFDVNILIVEQDTNIDLIINQINQIYTIQTTTDTNKQSLLSQIIVDKLDSNCNSSEQNKLHPYTVVVFSQARHMCTSKLNKLSQNQNIHHILSVFSFDLQLMFSNLIQRKLRQIQFIAFLDFVVVVGQIRANAFNPNSFEAIITFIKLFERQINFSFKTFDSILQFSETPVNNIQKNNLQLFLFKLEDDWFNVKNTMVSICQTPLYQLAEKTDRVEIGYVEETNQTYIIVFVPPQIYLLQQINSHLEIQAVALMRNSILQDTVLRINQAQLKNQAYSNITLQIKSHASRKISRYNFRFNKTVCNTYKESLIKHVQQSADFKIYQFQILSQCCSYLNINAVCGTSLIFQDSFTKLVIQTKFDYKHVIQFNPKMAFLTDYLIASGKKITLLYITNYNNKITDVLMLQNIENSIFPYKQLSDNQTQQLMSQLTEILAELLNLHIYKDFIYQMLFQGYERKIFIQNQPIQQSADLLKLGQKNSQLVDIDISQQYINIQIIHELTKCVFSNRLYLQQIKISNCRFQNKKQFYVLVDQLLKMDYLSSLSKTRCTKCQLIQQNFFSIEDNEPDECIDCQMLYDYYFSLNQKRRVKISIQQIYFEETCDYFKELKVPCNIIFRMDINDQDQVFQNEIAVAVQFSQYILKLQKSKTDLTLAEWKMLFGVNETMKSKQFNIKLQQSQENQKSNLLSDQQQNQEIDDDRITT